MASTSPAPISEGEWTKFVEKVSSLPPKKQRAISSIVGAFVADAAGKVFSVDITNSAYVVYPVQVFRVSMFMYVIIL